MRKAKSSAKYFTFLGKTYRLDKAVTGICFTLPALIMGILFVIVPMFVSLSYSFTDAGLFSLDEVHLNGIDNFITAFKDKQMLIAFGNTMEFVILVVPLQLGLALGLALILNKIVRFNTFFRWAFFCPVMLSLGVTSFLWQNLLMEHGMVNGILEWFGISPQPFLQDKTQAMLVIVFVSMWQGAGYQMLILLAGLKNIPKEQYEAASVDGASKVHTFFHITIPNLLPTLSFTLITMLIGAFRLITQPMIMTGGGPDGATMTMSYYIYSTAFGNNYNVGYSSAIAMIYTVFMAAIALTLRKLMKVKS